MSGMTYQYSIHLDVFFEKQQMEVISQEKMIAKFALCLSILLSIFLRTKNYK